MPRTSARLLAVLSLLQARRDWPVAALAERLTVSPRTVRRDIDRLRELGYPITTLKGPHGGYRLGAGNRLPPLLFDDEQAVAVAVALRTAALAGAGVEEAALRALAVIRQVMPERLRHRVDALCVDTVTLSALRETVEVDSGVLLALSDAMRAGEVLRFDYGSTDVPAPPRRVEPHHLVVWSGRWYLVAWDRERADWRVFRADRITPRTPTGPRFARRDLPGGDVATFVASRFTGSEGGSGWPCTGEVILDLPAAQVAPFAGDGMVEPLGPTRTRLVLGSWSWIALAATFGRFDADIEVLGPPALRDAFTHLAHRYTAAATR